MTDDDVPAVERITAAAFYDLDVTTQRVDWPAAELRPPERAAPWVRRMRHLIEHDGPGCWVAEDDDAGEVVGAAAALLREGMWGLSTFAVRPGLQARGVGRRLLWSALAHAPAGSPGIICSSHDPRAVRLYRLAGFEIHPAMLMWGRVRRTVLPPLDSVREGVAADIELLDTIDRASRGHAHGVDHSLLVDQYPLLVVERGGGSRGYAYLYPDGAPYLLAATDGGAASAVLWASLAASDEGVEVAIHNLTSTQGWAVDVGLAAGLALHSRGYLALRAMPPPAPYIPSGHFL